MSDRPPPRSSGHASPETATPSPSAPLPPDLWVRLRAPFGSDDVLLSDLLIDSVVGRGVARPVVRTAALLARLDAVLGPGGWDAAFSRAPGGPVRCLLRIGPASCGGLGRGADLAGAQAAALRGAARLFGMARGLDGSTTVAVETDDFGLVDTAKAVEALVARGLVAPPPDTASEPTGP